MSAAPPRQRVLWLINHATLMRVEVPLLLELGYEVFVPKIVPRDDANASAAVTFDFDASLSIPAEALDRLNRHNFYADAIDAGLARLLNRHFSAAIVAFFPDALMEVVRAFRGPVLARPFGRERDLTYTSALGRARLERIEAVRKRFWFAEAYPHLHEIEGELLRSRAVYLPLGMPEEAFARRGTWTGRDPRILFVCPRIASAPAYYGAIYRRFKEAFGDLPHIIAGAQPEPVDDPQVMGFQPRERFDAWLRDCRVMFYHGEEPRHLHYHPLEAIAAGMPVIYMRGGTLERYDDEPRLGACVSYAEARAKIERLLGESGGDYAAEIVARQAAMIVPFTRAHCLPQWRARFSDGVMAQPAGPLGWMRRWIAGGS